MRSYRDGSMCKAVNTWQSHFPKFPKKVCGERDRVLAERRLCWQERGRRGCRSGRDGDGRQRPGGRHRTCPETVGMEAALLAGQAWAEGLITCRHHRALET